MRKSLITFLSIISIEYANCQDSSLPRIENDTLFTKSGYKIYRKQHIKVGSGSTPDGDFKYIRTNSASIFNYSARDGRNSSAANSANALSRNNSGLSYQIKRIEKSGNKKHGYVYYAIINKSILAYEIDVENAIASGEVEVPEEFKPKQKATTFEIKQQISPADELKKWKSLLDSGIINQDEYDAKKKKILDNNE